MRILTNRNFLNKGSYEAIDTNFEAPDCYTWMSEYKVEYMYHGSDCDASGKEMIGFSFPVDVEFVKDKFKEVGREFDENKLQDLKDKSKLKWQSI